jgi:hypothetical protein
MSQSSIYYTYKHIHPETKEVVYVGYGSGHRAWTFNALVFRQQPHLTFLQDLMQDGWLPCDWVIIHSRNKTKQEAKTEEKALISLFDPKFNTHKGFGSMTCSIKKKDAKELRALGLSYSQIKNKMKLSSDMCAWRYVNAK